LLKALQELKPTYRWYRKTFTISNVPAEWASDGVRIELVAGDPSQNREQTVRFDKAELHIAPGDRFQYTGQEYDAETGLYYYGARYYDAGIGRFTTQDPLGTIDGTNLYTYVRNNPVNLIDPTGMAAAGIYGSPGGSAGGTNYGGSSVGKAGTGLSPKPVPPRRLREDYDLNGTRRVVPAPRLPGEPYHPILDSPVDPDPAIFERYWQDQWARLKWNATEQNLYNSGLASANEVHRRASERRAETARLAAIGQRRMAAVAADYAAGRAAQRDFYERANREWHARADAKAAAAAAMSPTHGDRALTQAEREQARMAGLLYALTGGIVDRTDQLAWRQLDEMDRAHNDTVVVSLLLDGAAVVGGLLRKGFSHSVMSVRPTATLFDVSGGTGINMADQVLLSIKYQSLINDLSRAPVQVRPGQVSRHLMGDLTTASGREVGLVRVDGQRYLVLGESDRIDLSWAERVIAHTHTSGDLRFSGELGGLEGDIPSFRIYQPTQRSSVLIAPDGRAVRLPIPYE
jgi:RHS repeat-associated protein